MSAEKNIASGFRRCVIAEPGFSLIEADKAAVEAVVTGWFARSASYIRLAALGVHDFLTSHLIGKPADLTWENKKLGAYFKEVKAKYGSDRELAKKVVHGCLPGDHEVLTPYGWERLDQLTPGMPVAQWDTGKINFVVPSAITNVPCQDGAVIELWGRGIRAQMTLDHRVPVQKAAEFPVKVLAARDLQFNQTERIPITGTLTTGDSITEDIVRLLAAIQADGTWYRHEVRFNLVKLRKIERLRALLTRLEIPFKECIAEEHLSKPTRFKFHPRYAEAVFGFFEDRPIGTLAAKKIFSLSALLTLDLQSRQALINEVQFWDGSTKEETRVVYLTTVKANAETIQTITHTCGRQALLTSRVGTGFSKSTVVYTVSFNNRKLARIANLDHHKLVPYQGQVYCVTVPSGFFMLRWKDRISVTGNSNYGLTPYGMAKRYPEMFTVVSATTLQDLYFKICPELKAWQDATRLLAHKQGYLSNPWGYKHWFWDVYGWNGKTGRYQRGKDHDRVVAYPGQSTSAGLLYEDALLVMEDRKFPTLYKGKSPVRALIHDSILAEIPDASISYCSAMFQRVMTREIPQLPCPTEWGLGPLLSIGVSVKVGKNWAPWSEKNPQGMKEVVEELGTASDTAVLEGEPEDEE